MKLVQFYTTKRTWIAYNESRAIYIYKQDDKFRAIKHFGETTPATYFIGLSEALAYAIRELN